MLSRSLRLTIGVLAVCSPLLALGQAAPRQFFVVCGSQPNLPMIYFSGVLQGPATAFAGFQAGFTQFLQQHYAYKGTVGCLPTNSAVNAENFINARSTALRNAKKNVVDTGWTENAPAVAALLAPVAVAPANPAKPAVAAPGAGTAGASSLTGVLGSIFGNGSGGAGGGTGGGSSGGSCGGAGASGAKTAASGGGCQSPFEQVATTLSSVFGNKSAGGASAAGAKSQKPGSQDGALGAAQSQTTRLVVYGCGRQDLQVACVTELANQNQKDTLVKAADVWTDTFIVDDRGDRHQRVSGFFLNIDGDQRPQLDISYGKTARFILMFDGVQAKVQKVALRSPAASLDVEEIGLITPNAGAQANQPR